MIFTQLHEIEGLVAKILSQPSQFIRIDMADYNRIADNSFMLKAVEVCGDDFNEALYADLRRSIDTAGREGVSSMLVYIGSCGDIGDIEYSQAIEVLQQVQQDNENLSIIWGIGSHEGPSRVCVRVIIGYN